MKAYMVPEQTLVNGGPAVPFRNVAVIPIHKVMEHRWYQKNDWKLIREIGEQMERLRRDADRRERDTQNRHREQEQRERREREYRAHLLAPLKPDPGPGE